MHQPHGETKNLMTLTEVARRFRVRTRTVSRWCDTGELCYRRTPTGDRRPFAECFDAQLAAHQVGDPKQDSQTLPDADDLKSGERITITSHEDLTWSITGTVASIVKLQDCCGYLVKISSPDDGADMGMILGCSESTLIYRYAS